MSDLQKICFVAPNAYPELTSDTSLNMVGGAQVQQCIIAKALVRIGYNVSMICLDFGQPDDLIVDGIRVLKAHKPDEGIPILRYIHPRTTSFWQAMKKANADIYYQRCASYHTGLVSFFCRQTGKKMVFSVASDSDLIPGQQLINNKRDKLIYEWGLKHANVIITQSRQQQELCKKNYYRESIYIRSCCEPYSCKICDDKQVDVLWVATIKSFKQPELFIELAQRMPELRFRMVGGPVGGNYRDSYYSQIKEQAELISNLEFLGFVPYAEIDKHFDEARLFVNTSSFEGFPNTFLQSWVRGIPTVSFFDPNKVFEGEKVGVVVRSVDEFVLKIKEMLTSPHKYERAGDICKKYTERFHSAEKNVANYSKVFASLIG